MPSAPKIYCLDSNCLIELWKTFCAPHRVEGFWEKMDEFALAGTIFIPLEVANELKKNDDGLKNWIEGKDYLIREPDERVTEKWAEIAGRFPNLVDNIKQRSLADPWVVAHAAVEGAVVVTMEGQGSVKRIKIPDVCKELKIESIGLFELLDALGFTFTAKVTP